MMSVIMAAVLLIILGYSAVGFSGYLAFPRTVSSNALNNFSDNDVLMQARLPPCLLWMQVLGRLLLSSKVILILS